MRLLVVEDEARIAELLGAALTRSGFTVDTVGGCEAARAAFTRAEQLAGSGPYADYARYMGAITAARASSNAMRIALRSGGTSGGRSSAGRVPGRF